MYLSVRPSKISNFLLLTISKNPDLLRGHMFYKHWPLVDQTYVQGLCKVKVKVHVK